MDEMSIKEVKELKEVQEKINSQARQQSEYTDQCHDRSLGNHSISETALLDLAATIEELSVYIGSLEERISVLEEAVINKQEG